MPDAVRSRVKDGDVVICMGAGSVGGVAPALAGLGGRVNMADLPIKPRGEWRLDEPMSKHVSWRAGGGNAEALFKTCGFG